ncbi:hypothetical protein GCM10022281_00480 [Sphingomonas rosea]|uniref:Uncharacterized protein n=1 Tax=Sphingomonas rosea TaxID=335605 RepID=A0ABP7TG94_9SPHN
MKYLSVSAFGLATVLLAGTASAQSTTPTPAPVPNMGRTLPPVPEVSVPSGATTGALLRTGDERLATNYYSALSMTSCAFSAPVAARVLSTPIGSVAEEQEINRYLRGNLRCSTATRSIALPIVRGAMAEWLVKRGGEAPVGGPRPGTIAFAPTAAKSLMTATDIALCHVTAQPTAARRVLDTQPGSAAEVQAESGLFTAAPTCGGAARPAGLNPVIYRGLIAMALASQAGRS